jgi:hypothetical protein
MGKRDYYKDAKQTLIQIHRILETEPLTKQQRGELEIHAAKLAGVVLRPWLPVSWTRRLIMAGIIVLGIQQSIWVGNYEPFAWWLLLPLFSPRIVGECAFQIGRVVGWFERPKPQHGRG